APVRPRAEVADANDFHAGGEARVRANAHPGYDALCQQAADDLSPDQAGRTVSQHSQKRRSARRAASLKAVVETVKTYEANLREVRTAATTTVQVYVSKLPTFALARLR